MAFPFSVKCKKCGRVIGAIVGQAANRLAPLKLEFACTDCIDKTARSKAITLDSETSWGKVMREMRSRKSR